MGVVNYFIGLIERLTVTAVCEDLAGRSKRRNEEIGNGNEEMEKSTLCTSLAIAVL